jgi:nucleolin
MSDGLLESVFNWLGAEGHKDAAKALKKSVKATGNAPDLLAVFKAGAVAAKRPRASSGSSSDSSSSSDSDSDSDKKPAAKVAKKADSSDSDSSSSSDSDSDDEPAAKAVAKKADSDSDSSSSSADSDAKPATKTAAKKEDSSSSSSSSSSDSSVSDSDDEKPAAKKAKVAESAPAAPAATDEVYKVYVKGLPWNTPEEDLVDFFKDCGESTAECPMQPDGRSTGTAFVTFTTAAAKDLALAKHEQTWPGTERWLSIQETRNKPGAMNSGAERPAGCDTMFIGNLAWDVQEETLREVFANCGDIKHVRFATDRETGEFKGFGHVQFYDENATVEAIKMHGTDVMGRAIRVDYAPPRPDNGGSPRGGGGGFGGRGSPGGRGGRGGRGDGGRDGGRGGGRGGSGRGGAPNKAKGSIAMSTGTKMTFDD